MLRFALPVVVLAVAVVMLGSSCTHVRVKMTGDILVHPDGGGTPETVTFETVKVVPVAPIWPITCVVTGIFYGGTCWLYFFAPFPAAIEGAVDVATDELRRQGRCAELVESSVVATGDGWYGDDEPMTFDVKPKNGLCERKPDEVTKGDGS